jgi:hypothetical protein
VTSVLSSAEREQLQLFAPSPAQGATHRAHGALHHLVALVALGRDRGMTMHELAEWNLSQAESRGYYGDWIERNSEDKVGAYLRDFVAGRAVLYDESTVARIPGGYEVSTRIWYHDDVPEIFFYYDVSLEEFSDYVIALAAGNAARCGVAVDVKHADKTETIRITKAAGQ